MSKFFITVCLVFFFSTNILEAQNYRTHKVKQGETIESISKEYYVTPLDIYALNPDAKNGLKLNSVLIIPKSKLELKPKVTIVKELLDFKKHRTGKKETLYSLTKKYNVLEEDIKNIISFYMPIRSEKMIEYKSLFLK